MTVEFSELSKRNLITILNILNEGNANLTHQRGKCDNHNCESCLNSGACKLMCDIAEEINKVLDNL